MECHPLEVVIFRNPEDGGVPCSLGLGPRCGVRLRRPDISSTTPWEIVGPNPCETHTNEWWKHRDRII